MDPAVIPRQGEIGFPKSLDAGEAKITESRICATVISPFFPSVRASECAVQMKGLVLL